MQPAPISSDSKSDIKTLSADTPSPTPAVAIPQTPHEKFRVYLTSHRFKYPGSPDRVIDEDHLNEVAGIPPLPATGVRIEVLLNQILHNTALFSDEQLRNAVLVSRMVRPHGTIHWILRFIYEARGLTFRDDP